MTAEAKRQIEKFQKKALQNLPEVKSVVKAMNKLKDDKADEKVWDDFGAEVHHLRRVRLCVSHLHLFQCL